MKKYLTYVIPTIIVMCINCTYNVIDQMFVGNIIGPNGLIALQTVGPLLLFLSTAFAAVFNSGSAIKVSQCIGQKDLNQANNYFGNMIWSHIFWCTISSSIALIFFNNFISLFNVSNIAFNYSCQYGKIMVFGAIFSALGPSLAFIFKNYGHPILSMLLISISLVLNIILDALLIPKFGMAGAAIGTVGSQFLLVVFSLIALKLTVFNQFKVKLNNIIPKFKNIKEIVKRGIPGLGDPISVFGTMLLHNVAITYYFSESYLPIYNCLFGMQAIGMAIVSGIILGIQPLISKAYGENNFLQTKNVFKFGLIFVSLFGLISTLIFLNFNSMLPKLFGLSGDLLKQASMAILISCTTFLFFGPVKVFYIYFQSINKTLYSALIAFIDIFVILPLCLFILPKLFGIYGIWMALPISKLIMLLSLLLLSKCYIINRKGNITYERTNIV